MKKLLISITLLFVAFCVYAQKNISGSSVSSGSDSIRNDAPNEIKLNLLYLAFGVADLSYERIFGENSGAGISVMISAVEDYPFPYAVLPYYRLYFGQKKACGFFIEGNGGIVADKETFIDLFTFDYLGTKPNSEKSYFAFGFAAGGKFLSRKGFIGEVFFGIDRLIGNDPLDRYYPRLAITIGKQF
jgi:hypothetical protein